MPDLRGSFMFLRVDVFLCARPQLEIFGQAATFFGAEVF
jgi:hypothetical protein